jgi:hypothetical protein
VRECFDLLCDACLLLNECGRVASTRKERRERDDEDYSSGTVVVVCCMGVNGVGSTVCVHTRTKIKGVMKKVDDRPQAPSKRPCRWPHSSRGRPDSRPRAVRSRVTQGTMGSRWAGLELQHDGLAAQ